MDLVVFQYLYGGVDAWPIQLNFLGKKLISGFTPTRTRQLNEFAVFLCIVHYGFNFLPFYPDFYYWS